MFFTLLNFYILLSFYLLQLFMEFCQFVAVGCSGFFFFFVFVFMEFCWFVAMGCLDLSFFCFCFFFLCRFPRFLLLPLLSNLWQRRIMKFLLLDFLFPLFFWLCNFYWIFGFQGFFYLISILCLFWFDIQCYCRLHLHWFSLSINYYNLWVFLYDSLRNVMLGLPLFWIPWEFFFEGWGWLVQLFEIAEHVFDRMLRCLFSFSDQFICNMPFVLYLK